MPRHIDPDRRRRELADAVWRVVRRDGLERASVRGVAAEAALSMGSLRHYFATQSELHVFAMRLVMDQIRGRVQALDLIGDPRRDAEAVLLHFLPLDDQRRAESEVWLAFTSRALIDPELRALRDDAYDQLHDVCRRLVTNVAERHGAADGVVAAEIERLYALLDGLLLHGVIRPHRAGPALLQDVLSRHLDLMCGSLSTTSSPVPSGSAPPPPEPEDVRIAAEEDQRPDWGRTVR